MGKRRIFFFRLLVSVLFAFAGDYSLFDTVEDADFFFATQYEDRDSEGLYVEKGSNLDGVPVSPALFSPLPDTFFEFLPSFFLPKTILVTTFSVLRC